MRIKLDWQGKALVPMPIIETDGLPSEAIKLFIILMDLREQDRDVSIQEIADKLGFTSATIYNHLRSLVDSGWIKQDKDGKIIYLRMHKPQRSN